MDAARSDRGSAADKLRFGAHRQHVDTWDDIKSGKRMELMCAGMFDAHGWEEIGVVTRDQVYARYGGSRFLDDVWAPLRLPCQQCRADWLVPLDALAEAVRTRGRRKARRLVREIPGAQPDVTSPPRPT